ncbi:ParB N-terminal domain-containing protein [Enterovibrio norvegicus]|uniref:ParB N-terminal domain-containing protein n=1 Tax=Enterovibrio norvegicus TaxID=188144 RepID=UPI000315EF8B|nr:ParB N-terminal domain-containing protein [Enterovibrio norvegicus]OEE69238.1 hypothetical protein A1OO_00855 [Enterovibrio norvegicus FF-33]PML76384.1 hypothetical protein BCT69_23550 [Enterovibrio norvegicus]PMN71259.1 hypothetical protein BCT27_17020 [Enterovibrio norvegicus]
MKQYIEDSYFSYLDPRALTLDPAMQARDTTLIRDKRLRAAQEIKQAAQDEAILEGLRNGVGIKQPITVFEVDDKKYVVDGFHRTGACLAYFKEEPESDLMIRSRIIRNRTYQEAFEAAQQMNQDHGVGVTPEEQGQSKFRALVVANRFELSVSEIVKELGCSRGQANHVSRALKACNKAIKGKVVADFSKLTDFIEHLQFGLESNYYLPRSIWDTHGFPKVRRLSDAVTGKDFTPRDMDNEEWQKHQINSVEERINRLLKDYDEDFFREGLRKAVIGSGLGISVSKRSKWLEQAGSVEADEVPEDWDRTKVDIIEDDEF